MAGKKAAVAATEASEEDLVIEIEKVKARIRGLTKELTDPDLTLSASVRLSVQKRELEAYLCGILFAMGEGDPLREGRTPEFPNS